MLSTITNDLRYAARALRTYPAFAAVAILSLALGIGANTAIFSLIDAVMLRSLPVSHPEELLQVTMGEQDYAEGFSNPVWEELRDRQDAFSQIFAYCPWAFNLAPGGEVRPANGVYASGQYFDTLRVRPMLGRLLTPADDKRGCSGSSVLSHGFWQREFGGRSDVIGAALSLNSHPFEIVGVAEPGFTGIHVGSSVDVFVPVCAEEILNAEASIFDERSFYGWLRVIGRPKPDVSPSQVTARLNLLAPQIFRVTLPENWRLEDQQAYLERKFETRSAAHGLSYVRTQYRQALIVLMVTVGAVLLIACANLANLLLARSTARQREVAIRVALGAGRGRLIRQLLTESLLLSLIGAAAGILFAQWGASLLVAYLDVYLDLALNARVLAFTVGIAVITGLLFGTAPAWKSARVQPQAAMKANTRGVIRGSRFAFGKMLVTAQVALSSLLVVVAGLMLSTFSTLGSLDPGFQRNGVLLMSADFRNGNYAPERRLPVFQEMLEKLRAIPGVQSASASNITPISLAWWRDELVIEGLAARSRDDATVYFNQVSSAFFETLGIGMIAGRDFDGRDTPTSPRVAIVNQALVKKYFREANPLGKYFRIQDGNGLGDPIEIVGIVKDSKYGSLRDEIPPTAYIAWSQEPRPLPLTNYELRVASGAAASLIPAVTSAIKEINPSLSVEFTTLAGQVDDSISREKLLAMLSGLFGALALFLAAIGLYGLMSYNVASRRNELGVRMALGADPTRVMRMVLGEIAILIGTGLALGIAAAAATTRYVASFLYGVTPTDPLILSLAAVVLAGVSFAAGYFPARRASRLDPLHSLREE